MHIRTWSVLRNSAVRKPGELSFNTSSISPPYLRPLTLNISRDYCLQNAYLEVLEYPITSVMKLSSGSFPPVPRMLSFLEKKMMYYPSLLSPHRSPYGRGEACFCFNCVVHLCVLSQTRGVWSIFWGLGKPQIASATFDS